MTELLNAEFEDETGTTRRLTREEILTYVTVIAGAGNETTTRLIGWAGKVLAEHPDQRRELVADPRSSRTRSRSCCGSSRPHRTWPRYVARDVEHYGTTVPEGSVMLFLVGSANRDDRRYPDGDRVRHPPHPRSAPHVRLRHPLLPRRRARLGSRAASRSKRCSSGSPSGRSTTPNAKLSPTSTVRGWETLPVFTHGLVTRDGRRTGAARRKYDSPVRRQRGGRRRGSASSPRAPSCCTSFAVWNWRALTVRGVAERARVNQRTVYRHFANERELRDAVMARLEEEAGVALEGLALDDIQQHTARILEYVSSFPLESRTPRRPDAPRRAPAPARSAARRGRAERPRIGRKPTAPSPRRCSTCCGASRPTNASSSTGSSTRRTRSRASPGSSGSSRTPSAPVAGPRVSSGISTRRPCHDRCLTSASLFEGPSGSN